MNRFPKIHEVSCRKVESPDTLLGFWYVSITHDAWCGHDNCGIDGTLYAFGTGRTAIRFINDLPESALEHQPVDGLY